MSKHAQKCNEITEGRLEVEYNPFLANNLLEAAQIISSVWATGAFSQPDIREWLDKPFIFSPNLGGVMIGRN